MGHRIAAVILFVLIIATSNSNTAESQTPTSITIVPNAAAFSTHNYDSLGAGVTLFLQGFSQPGDGGGGLLADNPAGTSYCFTARGTTSTTSNPTVITKVTPMPIGLIPGMGVQNSSYIASGTTVQDYSVANQTITMSAGATAPGTLVILEFTANSALPQGQVFVDAGSNCFVRVSPTYSQKEWGAVSDGATDDWAHLQNWISANQPHLAIAGTSAISTPLLCSPLDTNGNPATDGAVIQGPPAASTGANGQPQFLIVASSSFSATTAMLTMNQPACAISGVGLIGAATTNYDIVDATNLHSSVFNHSLLSGGNYGFACVGSGADIEILDSSVVNTGADGIHCPASNAKINRNVISGNSGDGIYVSATEVLIEGNVIEQNGGNGVNCDGAIQIGIIGNYFDNNGKTMAGTSNIRVNGCQTTSIVGNQLHRSSPFDEENSSTPDTAQVMFEQNNDSVAMSGNVNFVGSDPDAASMRPEYDVEFTTGATATNFNYSDSPTPQNSGIFGPAASAALGPFITPQAPPKYLSGLTTANVGTSTSLIISPGAATDSLNAQLISLIAQCPINLQSTGMGGLDTGLWSAAVAQYYFFVIAQGGYGSKANCIASNTSTPDFYAAATSSGTVAPYSTTMYGFLTSYSLNAAIVNVTVQPCNISSGNIKMCPNQNPFGGVAVGDVVVDVTNPGNISPNTTVTSLSSLNVPYFSATTTAGSPAVALSSIPTNLFVGEEVGNCTNRNHTCPSSYSYQTWIKGNVFIQSIARTPGSSCSALVVAPCFVMSAPANASGSGSSAALLTASGVYTLTLSKPLLGTTAYNATDELAVYNDRYRLVASLYTDSSGNIEKFTQDGDTFYLNSPVPDINSVSLTTSPANIVLASVPNGIQVEALGRCVATGASGGTYIHMFPRTDTTNTPTNFPTSPGFSIKAATVVPSTGIAFPYRIYTDTSATITAQASGNATLNCMTDGYVFHRSQ